MAQSQSDLFEFVIQPNFNTKDLDKQTKEVQGEFQKIAQRIYDDIQEAMGQSFTIPANVRRSSLSDVTELVTQMGGQVKRVGTTITATFKDADGVVRQSISNINSALTALETANTKIISTTTNASKRQEAISLSGKIEKYRTSGASSSGELEQQIVKSIQEQYNLEKKIQEAKISNNTVNEAYYTGLQNIAKQEETNYQTSYKGSQTRIDAIRSELEADQQLYNTKIQKQAAEEKAAQTEQNNLKESLDLLTQYQSVKSKLDTEEARNGTGSEYYQALDSQLNDIIAKMNQYGLVISQISGNVVFDDTATSAVKASENIDKVEKKVEGVNNALTTNAAKLQDVAKAEADAKQKQIDYDKQQKNVKDFESALNKLVSTKQRLTQLESQGKTNTEEYKVLTKQYEEAKTKLESFGATVSDTSVTITKQSSVVNGDAETLEKLSKKCKDASDNMDIYKAKAEDGSNSQNNFSKSIQDSVENFIKYQVAMEAINKITSEFTSAIYDMNEAMTQVRMVTMDSYEDTVQLADSYTQLAKQLGTTTTTVAEGADTWLNV